MKANGAAGRSVMPRAVVGEETIGDPLHRYTSARWNCKRATEARGAFSGRKRVQRGSEGADSSYTIGAFMVRFLTAGESHGRALVVILEGIPAGLTIDIARIDHELKR